MSGPLLRPHFPLLSISRSEGCTDDAVSRDREGSFLGILSVSLCLAEMVDRGGWGKTGNLGWQSGPNFFSKGKVSTRRAVRAHEPSPSEKHTESFLTCKLS